MWPVHPEENGGERYEVCSVDLVNGACPGQMVTVYRNAVGSPQGLESDFGPRRQESPMHQGIDYAVPGGTPVYAVRGGTIYDKGMMGNGGYTILIEDSQGMLHGYRHLTRDDQNNPAYPELVRQFQTVLEGQQIGWSGATGTDPPSYHLHYDYYQETVAGEQLFTNPLSILPYANTSKPVVTIEQPTQAARLAAFFPPDPWQNAQY